MCFRFPFCVRSQMFTCFTHFLHRHEERKYHGVNCHENCQSMINTRDVVRFLSASSSAFIKHPLNANSQLYVVLLFTTYTCTPLVQTETLNNNSSRIAPYPTAITKLRFPTFMQLHCSSVSLSPQRNQLQTVFFALLVSTFHSARLFRLII